MGESKDDRIAGRLDGYAQPVLLAIGLALTFQLMRNRCIQEIVPQDYLGWYLLFPSIIVLLAALLVGRSASLARWCTKSRCVLICSILATSIFAVAGVSRYVSSSPTLNVVIYLSGSLVGAIELLILLVAWCDQLREVALSSSRRLIIYLLSAELVSMFLSIMLFYLSPIRAFDIVFTPVFAAVCLLLCRKLAVPKIGAQVAKPSFSVPSPYVLILGVALMISIIICGMTFRFYPPISSQDLIVKFCIGVFEMLAIIALVIIAPNTETWVYLAWICVMCILMFGLLVFGMIEQDSTSVGMGVLTASRACSEAFLMITLVLSAKSTTNSGRVMSYMVVPTALGGLLGYVLIPQMLVRSDVHIRQALNLVSIAFGFVLTFGIIAVLAWIGLRGFSAERAARKDVNCNTDDSVTLTHRQFDATEAMAERYALTEREMATLRYLMRGYSLQKIAEAEVISINTVRSHVKNLYQKTSVHSRQEIIDLTESIKR